MKKLTVKHLSKVLNEAMDRLGYAYRVKLSIAALAPLIKQDTTARLAVACYNDYHTLQDISPQRSNVLDLEVTMLKYAEAWLDTLAIKGSPKQLETCCKSFEDISKVFLPSLNIKLGPLNALDADSRSKVAQKLINFIGRRSLKINNLLQKIGSEITDENLTKDMVIKAIKANRYTVGDVVALIKIHEDYDGKKALNAFIKEQSPLEEALNTTYTLPCGLNVKIRYRVALKTDPDNTDLNQEVVDNMSKNILKVINGQVLSGVMCSEVIVCVQDRSKTIPSVLAYWETVLISRKE